MLISRPIIAVASWRGSLISQERVHFKVPVFAFYLRGSDGFIDGLRETFSFAVRFRPQWCYSPMFEPTEQCVVGQLCALERWTIVRFHDVRCSPYMANNPWKFGLTVFAVSDDKKLWFRLVDILWNHRPRPAGVVDKVNVSKVNTDFFARCHGLSVYPVWVWKRSLHNLSSSEDGSTDYCQPVWKRLWLRQPCWLLTIYSNKFN